MQDAYAQALWRMVEAGSKPQDAFAGLRKTLEGHGRAALLPRIGRAFARIAARKEGERTVTLSVAREADVRAAKDAAKHILQELGVAAGEVEVRTDEALIGGWRFEGRERLLDASFRKSLLSIYNRVLEKY